MTKQNDIDSEWELINSLFLSAKMGKWQEVWNILGTPSQPRKTYLINAIPENRRWGIIHQAVYWRNKDVIRTILSIPGCDIEAKTKTCLSECGDTSGKTAAAIAEMYKYTDIMEVLKTDKTVPKPEMQTFQPYKGYKEKDSLGLITITLAAYKMTFHPSPVDPNKDIANVLSDIWKDMERDDKRWKAIRDIVADSVFIIDPTNSFTIKNTEDRNAFFESFIVTYTTEENYMYNHLSEALRHQTSTNNLLTGDDLALGPYAVVYHMLLLFWRNVPTEDGITYRRMLLSKADCEKYKVGTKFVWQSVVSSSTDIKCAVAFPTCSGVSGEQSIIFEIDNSTTSPWKPRNIEKYAKYTEKERTYPAGARFMVTKRSRKNSHLIVSLLLLEK